MEQSLQDPPQRTAGPAATASRNSTPHGGPLRAAIAERLFRSATSKLPLTVRYPDGHTEGGGHDRSPLMVLHDPRTFFHRLGSSRLIGFGESYQAGEWDSPALAELLTVFAAELPNLIPAPLQAVRRAFEPRRPRSEANSLRGARRNIERHYDLSDDLFELFLDVSMTYSAALFEQDAAGDPVGGFETLADAQCRKIDRLLEWCGVGPGTRLLEVGGGWGSLALRAAARGARVTTITLSSNQRAAVRDRVDSAGLGGLVDVQLTDYRAVQGRYDAVVSVEMIEAVGREHWPDYFAALRRLTASGGRIGLQAITMPHERMVAAAASQTWITKHIFPGGLIPSLTAIRTHARSAGFRELDDFRFGQHYAHTLRLWRNRFAEHLEAVAALGFDGTFQRTWELYLAYSEAGFAAGYLDVHQMVFGID
ncbi:class I SAM-dependent methyltransferase [Catenulispora subtropica]|uniref:Cyclopropane-fatty-acyl-phospholipid synthase family protein n=1 Tax=Catenulispora subtropica TaxID=450798 RepID=A0ABP5CMN7_9ACTN